MTVKRTRGGDSSVVDRLLRLCLSLFFAGLLLYAGVHLILAVFVPLLVITTIGLTVAALVAVVRHRRQGW